MKQCACKSNNETSDTVSCASIMHVKRTRLKQHFANRLDMNQSRLKEDIAVDEMEGLVIHLRGESDVGSNPNTETASENGETTAASDTVSEF